MQAREYAYFGFGFFSDCFRGYTTDPCPYLDKYSPDVLIKETKCGQ